MDFDNNTDQTDDLAQTITTMMTKIPKSTIFVPTTIEFLPLGLILLIICIVGLIGNGLSVLVLFRPKMQSTYSTTTLFLTLFDVIYLITKLFRYALAAFLTYFLIGKYYTHYILPIIGPQLRAITFTAHTGSTYFTIVVALDRYLAVTCPMQSKLLWTRFRLLCCCGFVTIFAILFNLPRWWEFSTESVFGEDNEVVAYKMQVTDFRNDSDYKLIYTFWMYFFVMFLIPFVLLSYLNFNIGKVIWDANKRRQELSTAQKRDNSFALMLIAVVIVFFVCSVDYLVIDWLDYYKIDVPEFLYSLGNVLLTINSAINFVIYCVFGKRFRDEFFKMLKESRVWGALVGRKLNGAIETSTTMSYKKSKWYSVETSSSSAGTDSDTPRI